VPRVDYRRIVSGIIFVIRNSPRCPNAKTLLGDRGYDADWFRAALADRGIAACIPSKANRKAPIPHDTMLYRLRIHTRYDRCAHTCMSAISLAAIVIFWMSRATNSPRRERPADFHNNKQQQCHFGMMYVIHTVGIV
jgi:transposase